MASGRTTMVRVCPSVAASDGSPGQANTEEAARAVPLGNVGRFLDGWDGPLGQTDGGMGTYRVRSRESTRTYKEFLLAGSSLNMLGKGERDGKKVILRVDDREVRGGREADGQSEAVAHALSRRRYRGERAHGTSAGSLQVIA